LKNGRVNKASLGKLFYSRQNPHLKRTQKEKEKGKEKH
jgi:hypothetical protein